MHIHFIQHVPFETPAWLLTWAKTNDYSFSTSHLYQEETLPDPQNLDLLIVMGGPMGIHDETNYPWLKQEKLFLKHCIESGKLILGICLGAQLIADVLGADVSPNTEREIGWFPITKAEAIKNHPAFKNWENTFTAFHWHGDTFTIPDGALPIGSSEACKHQGFIYEDRVIGLQFHLESTAQSIHTLIENCQDELKAGNFIQQSDVIQRFTKIEIHQLNQQMNHLLENLININSQDT